MAKQDSSTARFFKPFSSPNIKKFLGEPESLPAWLLAINRPMEFIVSRQSEIASMFMNVPNATIYDEFYPHEALISQQRPGMATSSCEETFHGYYSR